MPSLLLFLWFTFCAVFRDAMEPKYVLVAIMSYISVWGYSIGKSVFAVLYFHCCYCEKTQGLKYRTVATRFVEWMGSSVKFKFSSRNNVRCRIFRWKGISLILYPYEMNFADAVRCFAENSAINDMRRPITSPEFNFLFLIQLYKKSTVVDLFASVRVLTSPQSMYTDM